MKARCNECVVYWNGSEETELEQTIHNACPFCNGDDSITDQKYDEENSNLTRRRL